MLGAILDSYHSGKFLAERFCSSKAAHKTMLRRFPLPASLFGDNSPLGHALRAKQVVIAARATPPLVIGTLVNSVLVAYVLRSFVPWPALVAWVALNWIASGHRLRAWFRHRHRPPAQMVAPRAVMRASLWTGLAGVLWGMAALPLLWSEGMLPQMVLVFVIAGHAAVAVTWLSPLPAACWAYVFPTMVPLIGSVLAQGRESSVPVAIMLALYTGVLLHFSNMAFRSFRDMVRADVEREEAMRQLAQSKAEVELRVQERTVELRREQRLLQAIFDSVPIWLFVKDSAGRFLAVNRCMARELGKDPAQVAGKLLSEVSVMRPDTAELDARTDRLTLASGRMLALRELNCMGADGKVRTMRMVKVPLGDGQGGHEAIVGAAEDITERMRLEREVLETRKLQAVGQLAGGVAHEFNNLLQVIKGFTHLALREMRPQDPARSYLLRVIDSTVTAASLTSQLLVFGRRDAIRRETIDLAALMTRMTGMFRHILGKRIEIVLNQEAGLPPLVADRGMIEQAVMNLVLNARDAMPEGGRLTFETRVLEAHEPIHYLLGLERPGTYLEIRITDTGVGMPPEVLDRIFEPFFTTKEAGTGSGLGLSVAYGIVEQHEGKIRVQSRPGEGTSISIFLPAAGPEATAQAAHPAPAADLSQPSLRQRATILVAEDNDGVRQLAVQLLELEGYRVIQASDGVQAVRAWESSTEPIDLLVLDLVMPGQGGREAYERIASLQGDIPVIFVTGYISGALDDVLLANSAATLLRKPYGPDQLLHAVREALHSARRQAHQAVAQPPLPA
jgi:PAS domain S-box-containing protein